jgi:hypothetical protein
MLHAYATLELELELKQIQMAQKSILRAEVHGRALRARLHALGGYCDGAGRVAEPLFRLPSLPFCVAYGQQLEFAEGTSPRKLLCHCTDKAFKPSKARRGYAPSVSQRRSCFSLSSA